MDLQKAKEEIRERINIVDFIGRYVNLKKAGANYMGLCPFHNEKTPSFSVNEDKHFYKCFGCGKSGDIFNFLMEYEKIDFLDALKILAKELNIDLDFSNNNYEKFDNKEKETFYKIYKEVANEYYKILRSEKGKPGLEYFNQRKLTLDTIKKFGLGFAPYEFDLIYKFLKEKGYKDDIILKTGLCTLKNDKVHDLFINRVIFPIVDKMGKVIAFSGRIIDKEKADYKYINSPETIIYKKSNNVFGLFYAKKSSEKYYILCEGNLDVIMMHQAGFTNAVASLGTALTENQARLMFRDKKEIIISYDSDDAGITATKRAIGILEEMGFNIKILDLKPAKDPDEFIKKFGKVELEKRIANAKNSFLFLISLLKNEYDLKDPKEYEKYIEEILKKLSSFKDKIIRDKYLKQVAIQENLDENELIEAFSNRLKNNKFGEEITKENNLVLNKSEELDKNELLLLNYIFSNEKLLESISKYLNVDEFVDDRLRVIYIDLLGGLNHFDIYDKYKDKEDKTSKEIYDALFDENDNDLLKEDDENYKLFISDLIKKIKTNAIKNEMNKINKQSKDNEDFNKLTKLTKDLNEIKKMRIEIL